MYSMCLCFYVSVFVFTFCCGRSVLDFFLGQKHEANQIKIKVELPGTRKEWLMNKKIYINAYLPYHQLPRYFCVIVLICEWIQHIQTLFQTRRFK